MKATEQAREQENQDAHEPGRLAGDQPQSAGKALPGKAGLFRFSAALYLLALLFLFCITPFIEQIQNGDIVETVLITLVLGTGVLAIGRRRKNLLVAAALALPALVGKWANHLRPDLLHPAVFLAAGGVCIGFVVVQLLRFILRSPRVTSDVLCAGLAGYLTLGLLWTFAYLLISRIVPGGFAVPGGGTLDRFTALYFSIITLTTTGYGDVTPVANSARMVAMMEAITGTFYVAVLISRLVALYSSSQGSHDESTTPPTSIL